MTSVPPPVFSDRGYIVPEQSSILGGVFSDLNIAFGGNLDPGLTTPQGQLATSTAAIIGNVDAQFVYMTNQFNPALNSGRWQDGIAYIYFITRKSAEPTVVQATCYGSAGVTIPAGSLAQTADGTVYISIGDGVIGVGGTVVISFSSTVPGPLACPANTLNVIYQSIPGWDAINNLADGVIGRDTENRADFEFRRFESVAGNSSGALPAIRGAVLSVANVLDAYVTENTSASPVTVGGVTLDPKSLYVAAVGGTDADVARAIWTKKAPGCSYNGNTTVTVYDTNYSVPQPSYDVKFERPDPTSIIFDVELATNALVPANVNDLVQAAVIAAFSGQYVSTPRPRIASKIYASQYYAPVAVLGEWVQIISIKIGCINNSTASCDAGTIAGTAFTEAGTTTGVFAIGQTLVNADSSILPGTVILSGTSPNWVVSLSQTVGAGDIVGILADQDDVTMQIDQAPTISADNIKVAVT